MEALARWKRKNAKGKRTKLTFNGAILGTNARIQPFELVALVIGTVRQIRGTSWIVLGHYGTLVRTFVPSPYALSGKVALAESPTDCKIVRRIKGKQPERKRGRGRERERKGTVRIVVR